MFHEGFVGILGVPNVYILIKIIRQNRVVRQIRLKRRESSLAVCLNGKIFIVMQTVHRPVLLKETLTRLLDFDIKKAIPTNIANKNRLFIDGTFGGGGVTRAILRSFFFASW